MKIPAPDLLIVFLIALAAALTVGFIAYQSGDHGERDEPRPADRFRGADRLAFLEAAESCLLTTAAELGRAGYAELSAEATVLARAVGGERRDLEAQLAERTGSRRRCDEIGRG